MLDINGKTLLERTIEGVSKADVDKVVVATTRLSQPIIKYCYQSGVSCVQTEDEDDILYRIWTIIAEYPCDIIIRVWGDNPLPFCWLINESVDYFNKHNFSYVVFHSGDSYCSVAKSQTYLNLDKIVTDPKDRFDIHTWMVGNLYSSIVNYPIPMKFTIDTQEDLDRTRLWLK
jgi:spore coat polysaccharide biosynthesis protein SpsF (cytidylyltransferase family)